MAGPSLTKIPPATGMPARLNTAEGGRFLFALSGWAGYWRGVGALSGDALLPGNSACTISAIKLLVFG